MRASLLLLLLLPVAAAAQTRIEARVEDGRGAVVAYATVLIAGTTDGAATDADGRAAFETERTGAATIEARFVGYESARAQVGLSGDTVRVRLVLRERLMDLGAAVVSADAFASGADVRGLSALDVVTTPGAAADLFQAIRSFPGLTAADDGAGLFVRGGDVSETAVLLDGARLLRPYQFESPQGGARSSVSPFLVRGTRFSSGGFSARYGDALSGVLALGSQNEPTARAQTLDIGLAGASVGASVPVGRGGVRLAGTRTFTDALFWVNGRGGEFETAPQATSGSALAVLPLAGAGRVKLLAMGSADRIGVRVDTPSGPDVYDGRSRDVLGLVEWTALYAGWAVSATASRAARRSEQRLGALRLQPAASSAALRATAERSVSLRLVAHVGAEADRQRATARGEAPVGDVTDRGAQTIAFDETTRGTRLGVWAEAEAKVSRRLVAIVGIRADHHTALGQAVLDPRANLLYALGRRTHLRLAAGRYSQAPGLSVVALAPARLGVQRAHHLVGGVLHERGRLTLRAEAYVKTYRGLSVARSTAVLGGDGTGRARGLDLFARWGNVEASRASGWVSVSLLDTRRTLAVRNGAGFRAQNGRPGFGVARQIDAVGKLRIGARLVAAGRARVAGGRPATAVERTVVGPDGVRYPVDSAPGAQTLPAFARLDASLSTTVPLGRLGALVLYVATDNLLDRANAVGFAYSADYSERRLDPSPYRRSVYAGLTFLFS